MEPTKKTDSINDFISDLAGRDRVETITNNLCMSCGKPANDFRDELSQKEYSISGLCQNCQDDVFDDDAYYDDDYDYDDGQPDEYTEWQDYMGGDDWDFGQHDNEW